MVASFGGYDSACKNKKRHQTEADARRAAKKLRKHIGAKTRPYLCQYCGLWHNGHLRHGVYKDIRQKVIAESIEKY